MPAAAASTQLADAKEQLWSEVAARAEQLVDISHRIWDNPELNFEEHFAHDLLTQALQSEGLEVTRGACDLPTAFVAEAGTQGPTVAVVCEYDALPGIGHACGHNIIAAAGLGAGLALAALAEQLGGRVRILGTPAEEGGGGKVFMQQAGAFDGLSAAMMVHPANKELDAMSTLAVQTLRASYTGRAAHAAAAPHEGRNALDGAVLGYLGVAALRQHIKPHERVHGVFTHGGDKPNIVPSQAETFWYVRADDSHDLAQLSQRVESCLQAGAHSSGCELACSSADMPPYDSMVTNEPLAALYVANAVACGRLPQQPDADSQVQGSTDMGNVSRQVPAIHPMIKVAPDGVFIHTPEFADYTRSPEGDAAVIDGAKVMAATVADLWLDAGNLEQVSQAFSAA